VGLTVYAAPGLTSENTMAAKADTLIIRRSKKKIKQPTKAEIERMKTDEIIRRNPGRTA